MSLLIELWALLFPCSRKDKLVGWSVFSVLPSFFLNCGKSLNNKETLQRVCKPVHTWVKLNFSGFSDDENGLFSVVWMLSHRVR